MIFSDMILVFSMITNVKLDILQLANIKYELLFHRISFIIVETFYDLVQTVENNHYG